MFAAELTLNPSGRRGAPRGRIDAPGSFFDLSNRRTLCRISNLSATGARLELFDEIDARCEIELRLPGGLIRRASIIWVDEFECGCAFDRPIPQARIDALLGSFGDEDEGDSLPISKS